MINSANLIINKGKKLTFQAVQFDAEATKFYKMKKYQLAIDYWTEAKSLVTREDSYSLNIAMSYCQLKKYNKAMEVLRSIEEEQRVKSQDGKFEFISGYTFIGLNKLDLACKYLRASKEMGNTSAAKLLKTINCQTK